MKVCYYVFCVLLVVPFLLAAPHGKAKFDQRQEGEMNVRAELSNILILFIPTKDVKLVDPDQVGTILQIVSGKTNKPNKESPYKVDIDKTAIENLQNDMDNVNSIIPIRKSFIDIEKKESVDIKLEESPSTTEASTTSSEVTTTVEAVVSLKPAEKASTTEKVPSSTTFRSTTTSTTAAPQTTQEEKVKIHETPKPEIKKAADSKEKIVQVSPIGVTIFSPKSPPQVQKQVQDKTGSKTPKDLALDPEEQGVVHCSPEQQMSADGTCVNIENRESRVFTAEDLEQLLSILRLGIEPAKES